ncbi:MAG: class I SAM-dependent methyltransferase [Candidatus Woesearchaeota archaeon]
MVKKNLKIQVNKKHYSFLKYTKLDRWNSLWYQITEILKLNPKTVLEIGSGGGIVKEILNLENIKYHNLDIDEKLNPTYISDLKNVDIKKKFDCVVAFQVLEHLPYRYFDLCLKNLNKLSNGYILISLPRFGPYINFKFKLFPFIDINFLKSIPFRKKIKFDGQHYWEIGGKGYSLKKIKKDISKKFKIIKDYRIKENPYHQMFILKKK